MVGNGWMLAGAVVVAACVFWFVFVRVRRVVRESRFVSAMKAFHQQRQYLEATFFELASRSGKPRGLNWTDCDFDNDVTYARDRKSGDLAALVGATIGFSAIEGGGMEDVEAVGNFRAATAVFHFRRGRWSTEGRALFNLDPTEVISYYHENLVMVNEERMRRVAS